MLGLSLALGLNPTAGKCGYRHAMQSEHRALGSLAPKLIEHRLFSEHARATDQLRHWADENDEFRAQIEHKLLPILLRHLEGQRDLLVAPSHRRLQRKLTRHRAAGTVARDLRRFGRSAAQRLAARIGCRCVWWHWTGRS